LDKLGHPRLLIQLLKKSGFDGTEVWPVGDVKSVHSLYVNVVRATRPYLAQFDPEVLFLYSICSIRCKISK
jgi:hypothetical protein